MQGQLLIGFTTSTGAVTFCFTVRQKRKMTHHLSLRQRVANTTLFALVLFYMIMLGGGNCEHLNVTPVIASAPPKSLAMMHGPYGFSPVKFWVIFRPLTILLFVFAISFNWKLSIARKKLLIIAFVIDTTVTVTTFTYFAPEAGVIASAPFDSTGIDASLLERGQLWKSLNTIRLAAFYLAGIILLFALNRNIATPKHPLRNDT